MTSIISFTFREAVVDVGYKGKEALHPKGILNQIVYKDLMGE
ncbi:unnamed protein product [Trifolium pratense]|uniref:Uncharacterized protein n=1 Tax=Trifolium pratense TaxID=57577 RepID=A0ACB0LC63_TRIPR|nr:unnamed protein product [Trifolium pratense]